MGTDLIMKVQEKLKELVDEETGRRFGELNIVTEVSLVADGAVLVRFRPLSPYSPIAVGTGRQIRDTALTVEGVTRVTAECTGHMMDDLVNRLVNKEERQEH